MTTETMKREKSEVVRFLVAKFMEKFDSIVVLFLFIHNFHFYYNYENWFKNWSSQTIVGTGVFILFIAVASFSTNYFMKRSKYFLLQSWKLKDANDLITPTYDNVDGHCRYLLDQKVKEKYNFVFGHLVGSSWIVSMLIFTSVKFGTIWEPFNALIFGALLIQVVYLALRKKKWQAPIVGSKKLNLLFLFFAFVVNASALAGCFMADPGIPKLFFSLFFWCGLNVLAYWFLERKH
jgi:hypothetical protein